MLNFFKISDSILNQIIKIRNRGIDSNKLRIHRCQKPVVSIGNLSFGGSGKTPLTIAIATELLNRGINSAIIGKGYKRIDKTHNLISTGEQILTDWKSAGDEMYLIASKLKLPVIVHDKKFVAAMIADDLNIDLILVDDGFQHRQLHRDIDIVILDKYTLDMPYLPPWGRLRESVDSLKRADFIFVHEGLYYQKLEYKIADKQIIKYKTEIDAPIDIFNDVMIDENMVSISLSGIANPKRFHVSLLAKQLTIQEHIIFNDHHVYKSKDIEMIIDTMIKAKIKQLITTEKDAVKLNDFREYFARNSVNVFALPIRIEITENKEALFSNIQKLLVK